MSDLKYIDLCAGFPCQAFSISGKQLGFNDTRGTLFFDVARIIKFHQPELVILENVKNLLNHNSGKTFKTILKKLDELDYTVFFELLNASNFGVAQKRERLFILAFHKNLNIKTFDFPKANNKKTKLLDFILEDQKTKDFIIDRQDIVLRDLKIEKDTLGAYPQKAIRIGTVNKGGQGERIYHELGHAITLSAYGGGIGAKTGLYKINGKIRKLAPRECARLTTFPENFIIPESKNIAYRQFGNSIVVNVIEKILRSALPLINKSSEL